jgi:hypothetical protein
MNQRRCLVRFIVRPLDCWTHQRKFSELERPNYIIPKCSEKYLPPLRIES